MKEFILSSQFINARNPQNSTVEHIKEGLLFHKELGFKSVDFGMSYLNRMNDNPENEIIEISEISKEVGVHFRLCHLPFISQKIGVPDESFNKSVYKAIDMAKLLGCDYAVMHPNSTTVILDEFDKQKEYDKVMSYLEPFVKYAHKVGVNIVLENMRTVHGSVPAHRFCSNPDELCEVADTLGMGICWDTGHAHITGLKQSDAIEYIGSRLKMLHINDNFADDDIHLPPFIGTVDWTDTMHGLYNISYNGIINFEVASKHLPPDMRKAFGEYLIKSGQKLISLIK